MDEPKKPAPGSVKTFTCPNCGGTIGIRAVGITVTAVCQNCGSLIDVANEQLRLIKQARDNTDADLDLALGARGTLFGNEWEVIGYSERGDRKNTYSWSEYLLFNPWHGFRYLVESDWHWTFVEMLREDIGDSVDGRRLTYDGKTFKLFFRDTVKIDYVLGEFYWRVTVGEMAQVEDYISPPYILSMEQSGEDIVWSEGIYVPAETIRSAFGVKDKWREPSGIGSNQPNRIARYLSPCLATAGIALAFLVFFQIIAVGLAKSQVLLDSNMVALSSQKDTPQVTDAFDIPDRTGNIEIVVSAPIDNDWVEIDAQLVNQVTQEKYEAVEVVEYYHGFDADGAWQEGSRTKRDILSGIPGGKYRLLLTTDAGVFATAGLQPRYVNGQPVLQNAGPKAASYQLKVTRDVADWSNFWTAFLFLAAVPLAMLAYHWNFEKRRWADCDLPAAKFNMGSLK